MRAIASQTMMLAAVTGLLLGGCGDYDNERLKEDLEFLHAVPAKASLDLRVAQKQPRQVDWHQGQSGLTHREDALLGQLAAYYLYTALVSAGVNRGVFGFLLVVDWITRLPFSLREPNRRVWGPWPAEDDPGTDVRFEMVRREPGRFAIAFQVRPEALRDQLGFDEGWTNCVHGEVWPHQQGVRRGNGQLTIDLSACASVTGSGESGSASVIYDTRPDVDNPAGKTDLSIEFDEFLTRNELAKGADAQPVTAVYTYQELGDLSGRFDFTAYSDLNKLDPKLSALEKFEVFVRWRSDGSGRADARVSEGDLGSLQIVVHECWDAEHKRVYYSDPFPENPTEGSADDCSLEPTPFE